MFTSRRESAYWFGAFIAVLAITIAFDDFFSERALEVSSTTSLVFFGMNLGVMSLVVFVFARFFVSSALAERSRANRLLLNVLPVQIAEQLKVSDDTIADHCESVSVLFADIVGSTPLFENLTPEEVVDWLNEVYSAMDAVVEEHGLEKIRTIGDNYMVAAGVPTPRADHAEALVHCALGMNDAVQRLPSRHGRRIELRFGVNSGPVVAGVIGKSKFHYDIWGDTVNVAARMESHGLPGRTQVSESTHSLIVDSFDCTPRGIIEVKGKGPMQTWIVDGPKREVFTR
jgi:guanylate cyclase